MIRLFRRLTRPDDLATTRRAIEQATLRSITSHQPGILELPTWHETPEQTLTRLARTPHEVNADTWEEPGR